MRMCRTPKWQPDRMHQSHLQRMLHKRRTVLALVREDQLGIGLIKFQQALLNRLLNGSQRSKDTSTSLG